MLRKKRQMILILKLLPIICNGNKNDVDYCIDGLDWIYKVILLITDLIFFSFEIEYEYIKNNIKFSIKLY